MTLTDPATLAASEAGGDPGRMSVRDPEFQALVNQGADFLARGQLAEARDALERAVTMYPEEPRGQNLLGITYYQLGLYAPALEIYAYLTQVLPMQASLRLNHALVLMRVERYEEARQELEQALLIDPLHRRAAACLGWVASRQGDFRRARDAYRAVGAFALSEQMAARLTTPDPPSGYDEITPTDLPGEVPLEDVGATPGSVVPCSQFLDRFQLRLPPLGDSFMLSGSALVTRVERLLYQRLEGTVSTMGELGFAPELKRYRGRAAQAPFGPPGPPLHRITGPGALVTLPPADGQFLVLQLKDDIVYVREELVFGFDGGLVWENGRIPQRGGEEVPLVHLRGRGRLVLCVRSRLRGLRVEPDRSAFVGLPELVGWFGRIVPKLVVREPFGPGRWVECMGEGTLLLELESHRAWRAAGLAAAAPAVGTAPAGAGPNGITGGDGSSG